MVGFWSQVKICLALSGSTVHTINGQKAIGNMEEDTRRQVPFQHKPREEDNTKENEETRLLISETNLKSTDLSQLMLILYNTKGTIRIERQ